MSLPIGFLLITWGEMNDAVIVSFPWSDVWRGGKSSISFFDHNLVNDLSRVFNGGIWDRSLSAETSLELLKKSDPSWDSRICERSEIAELALFFSELQNYKTPSIRLREEHFLFVIEESFSQSMWILNNNHN